MALGVASSMAAITYAIQTITQAEDNIIADIDQALKKVG